MEDKELSVVGIGYYWRVSHQLVSPVLSGVHWSSSQAHGRTLVPSALLVLAFHSASLMVADFLFKAP